MVTPLDWGIGIFIFLVSLWGAHQGFVTGAFGLVGLAFGALAGSRLAPVLIEGGSSSPYAPLVALAGAVLLGSLALTIGATFGARIRDALLRRPGARILDAVGGGLLTAAVGLGLIWVLGAAALYLPGAEGMRRDVQRSYLLGSINRVMPPSGPLIRALHRIDPAPLISVTPDYIERPGKGVGRLYTVRQAAGSVVRVSGVACGIGVMGSGWPVAEGLIVTNAHVVAGESETRVEAPDGSVADATVVAFSPRNDLAILRSSLPVQPLPLGRTVRNGDPAAVIGYPEDGPLTVTPARLGDVRQVLTGDAYGRGPFEREVISLRADVRRGNSGGPLVDRKGRVVGTVFAATIGRPAGGLAVPNRLVSRLLAGAGGPVSTGRCTG